MADELAVDWQIHLNMAADEFAVAAFVDIDKRSHWGCTFDGRLLDNDAEQPEYFVDEFFADNDDGEGVPLVWTPLVAAPLVNWDLCLKDFY